MNKNKKKKYQEKYQYKLQLVKAMAMVVDCAANVADNYIGTLEDEMEKFWDLIDSIEEMQEDFDNGKGKSWEAYYERNKQRI